ncbi:tetratricopeptide repeat protein [Pseudemcibacter aquimaris]|uniref:tetratricopeptide repeat protein n=1 Tax=Pseudemcibacter aquimaris TaxID=2857064 RepID=UPI00201131BC|nr:hypothetical protein [Pseudemcibacter aquimaris]MCC3860030.1 hypothetical protein [Pseudemcibacter aquimaris]WDU57360.1 hypothetical protein KW060_09130 [Pseudemcibacter aquimaris]
MKFLPLLVPCALLMLTACDTEQTKIAEKNTETENIAVDTGPDFDLVSTPVGSVSFTTGCHADASELVERGVALMHHMMYDEARMVFSMANDTDSGCAMAYWGEAMTYVNPLWPGAASPELMARGLSLIEKAKSIGGHNEREQLYIQTGANYFVDGITKTEKERLKRTEMAWKILHETYPEDLDAKAYYALFMIATSDIADPDLVGQRKAADLAFEVLAENPDHPGAHHYVIHAYDNPVLAGDALETADNYGAMTPRVPHATHMMTHTYTRLGLWDKAIEWNSISAETALAICIETGEVNLHYTHALDYLAYAYLQKGDDASVIRVLGDADELKPPYSELNRAASAYAFSALPARYALERRDWQAASEIAPRMPVSFPWEKAHDQYVAISHFAKALGLSHMGKFEEAEVEIERLHDMHEELLETSPYWAGQVEIQEVAARGWQVYLSGDHDYGLSIMQRAADLEAATEKHAVTPGEVLPAAELYGDMLLASEKYEEALNAYKIALNRSPGRYNSLHGAATAAMGMGDSDLAEQYLAELRRNTENVEGGRKVASDVNMLLAGL